MTESKPTISTLRLAAIYVAIALARQVAHDVRNLARWARA